MILGSTLPAARRRAALADLLRSRREALTPEAAGIAAIGRRRTPGLRRLWARHEVKRRAATRKELRPLDARHAGVHDAGVRRRFHEIDHSLRTAHRPQGGGKIESVIGTVQRELWEVVQLDDVTEAERALAMFFADNNHRRAHLGISSLVPRVSLQGPGLRSLTSPWRWDAPYRSRGRDRDAVR